MKKSNVEPKFTFLTWNIDGLDDKNITERTMDVINTIRRKMLDVIFLQEVISKTYSLIEQHLSGDYYMTENKSRLSDDQWYFTVNLIKKVRVVTKNMNSI